MTGDRDVIEAGDRNFSRDIHACIAQRTERSDRHCVVRGEDRGGPWGTLEKSSCGFEARVFRKISPDLERAIIGNARFGKR